jgi:hypothetical protein
MEDMARTTKGDAARGDVVVERAVAWHHAGDVTTAQNGLGQGSASPTAPMHGWVVTAASWPSRTLGHLLGRRARSDLGAHEEGITIGSVRRRMGEELPGLICNSSGEANTRGQSKSRAGGN